MNRPIRKQQHSTSCGATAVINTLKWLGYANTYKSTIKDLANKGYEPTKAKSAKEISDMLNAFGIKFKLHKRPTVSSMKKVIKNGNSILFAYDNVTELGTGGHCIFIDYHAFGFFNAYNYSASGNEMGMLNEDYIKQAIYISRINRKGSFKGHRDGAWVWEIIKE